MHSGVADASQTPFRTERPACRVGQSSLFPGLEGTSLNMGNRTRMDETFLPTYKQRHSHFFVFSCSLLCLSVGVKLTMGASLHQVPRDLRCPKGTSSWESVPILWMGRLSSNRSLLCGSSCQKRKADTGRRVSESVFCLLGFASLFKLYHAVNIRVLSSNGSSRSFGSSPGL